MAMPLTGPDPLHAYREGARIAGTERPVPLVGTHIDVRIAGGLAVVSTERRFRNAESQSIEATITFPIPTAATLTGLVAEIDGRLLTARCQRRTAARETYEAAIDAGKTGVLHEELLRGAHMLSVGHIPAGAEMRITSVWAAPMSLHGTDQLLRIPTTVGEIFGRSPLPDSDDLAAGPHVHTADLSVTADGTVTLVGGQLADGRAHVLLNAPIEIIIAGAAPRALEGVAADGRRVILAVRPAAEGEAALDLELLLDESGSMASPGTPGGATKWDALIDGLSKVAASLRPEDRIAVRAFSNSPRLVGEANGHELERLIRSVTPNNGGTEIGQALESATGPSGRRDVLLVTDGKSHAIDVQAIARRGRRVTTILIGEDSLEAHVGLLSALTGGEIFVSSGDDAGTAAAAAIKTLRRGHRVPSPIEGAPAEVRVHRGGMVVEAHWEAATPESP
ncbi:MAG TPA: VIT domain-containing protein, partial [Stellaceae bacterium]|nr:VIT domain-containing protein [Stellaceae bacterium]